MLRNVWLLHPLTDSEDIKFSDILIKVGQMNDEGRTVFYEDLNIKLILKIALKNNLKIITLQELKTGELGKIADEDTGENEEPLGMPPGKLLSYKNIFIYDEKQNILGYVKLNSHPQQGKLKFHLEKILQNLDDYKNIKIRFGAIFEKGLVEKIKNAKNITTAEFVSTTDAEDVKNNETMKKHQDWLGGKYFNKTTKITGKKGANIKSIIQSFIDDYLGNNDISENFTKIGMTIDGEYVNFFKYWKKIPVEILEDRDDKKYVNYKDLEEKLLEIVSNYEKNN